jgi:steroid delta-isomerase-like uncharacterized protein
MFAPPPSLAAAARAAMETSAGMDRYRFSLQSVRSWCDELFEAEATKCLFAAFGAVVGHGPDDAAGAEISWLFASVLQAEGNKLERREEGSMGEQAIETAALDPVFAEDFAARGLEAWNSHEQERILALMHEDCVYEDSAWPRTMRSHADVREFLDSVWQAFPDLRFEPDHGPFVDPTERAAAFYWRGYATHTGPLDPPGLAPTGRRIQPEGGDFHEYRDGKLSRVRIVFDMADTMRQLGVLPATGSREEHLITRLARLRAKLGRRR